MNTIKTNTAGGYEPEIVKPVIHITNELAPSWLVHLKSRQQEYTILCQLKIEGRYPHKYNKPKKMEATVYYSKLPRMDEAGQ